MLNLIRTNEVSHSFTLILFLYFYFTLLLTQVLITRLVATILVRRNLFYIQPVDK